MKAGALILLGIVSAAAQTRGPSERVIHLSEENFTRARLIANAQAALGLPTDRFTLMRFRVQGQGPQPPKPSDLSLFTWWRPHFESLAGAEMQVAELVRIDDNAVLRIHYVDGTISRELISGRDPLHLTVGGQEFELVYFWFPYYDPREKPYLTEIFVRAHSPLDTTTGVDLFRQLEPLFPGSEVRAKIRNDAWFVYEWNYPIYNPFNTDRHVPSESAYKLTRTMTCTRDAGEPSCQL